MTFPVVQFERVVDEFQPQNETAILIDGQIYDRNLYDVMLQLVRSGGIYYGEGDTIFFSGEDSDNIPVGPLLPLTPDSFVANTARPITGFILGDLYHTTKWYVRGGLICNEIEDPFEIRGGRSTGDTLTNTLCLTELTVAVDLNTDTSITCLNLHPDNDAWPASTGIITIQHPDTSGIAFCTFSGINRTTGVISGLVVNATKTTDMTLPVGSIVNRVVDTGTVLFTIYAMADSGEGGFQERSGQMFWRMAEPHSPDGFNHYYAGGQYIIGVTTLGPNSARVNALCVLENRNVGLVGSWAEDAATSQQRRRLTVSAPITHLTRAENLALNGDLMVDAPQGYPASGSLTIVSDAGSQTVTYTSIGASNGDWYFIGCSGGTGTAAINTVCRLAKTNLPVVIGAHGQIAAHDFDGDAGRVVMGKVGPAKEGGILAGDETSNPVVWYRKSTNTWGTPDHVDMGANLIHSGTMAGFFGSAAILQPTTASASANFVANTSGIVDNSATWDGYTMGKVVRALRDLGFLD